MHISFLLHHAWDVGGTIRTTFNLAAALAGRHDVEIVSVFRRRDPLVFTLGRGVRLRALVDLRPNSPRYAGHEPEHARPSRWFPHADGKYSEYSALTDRRIDGWLRSTDTDVLVGTRPGLNTQLALRAGHGPVVVGQEHVPLAAHTRGLRLTVRDVYPLLDALTTVTRADALDYRARMPLPGVRLEAVPNAVPAPGGPPSDGTGRVLAAAGRLVAVKRYDLLLDAFAAVSARHPDWHLRIYGRGPQRAPLEARIDALGLRGRAHLMGLVHPLDPEWAAASIAVSTSHVEAFGMTLVEAMRCGLPVVSTRCPHGPAEIISDGLDGRLVPVGDTGALTSALLELVGDGPLRRRMGREALQRSGRFDPARVAERYEDLFAELAARPRSAVRRRRPVPAGQLRGALHRTRGAAFRQAYGALETWRRTHRPAPAGTGRT